MSESYWHLHLTPSAETLARYAEDGEEPTPPCRHLLAYPPKPGHEARYENHWTCPDCGDTLWCEHPAEHALTYWRNRGCIACTIAGMRDKLTQDLTATTSGPVRSEDAPADPALKGWALALSRVPTCPNPNHEHRGFRCSTSGLPLAYGQWERLRQQPFELEYDATGQPSNVKRTVRVMEAMWQDEAVACYLIDVLHADLPADHPMRQRYDKLHAAYEREVAKLTCPHKHKTYTAGKILGKMLITVCKDCGAYLSTGVPR